MISWINYVFGHSTCCVHASLFEGATDVETLCSKKECDHFLKENVHSVRARQSDNSQFDSKDFQWSYEEGHQ